MSKGRDRTIFQDKDGQWVNKRNDASRASRASSRHSTQAEAKQSTKAMLKNQGGGDITTMGRDGKIRSKDTIPPGNDPLPPRDREH